MLRVGATSGNHPVGSVLRELRDVHIPRPRDGRFIQITPNKNNPLLKLILYHYENQQHENRQR
jgi:hypothetical protein